MHIQGLLLLAATQLCASAFGAAQVGALAAPPDVVALRGAGDSNTYSFLGQGDGSFLDGAVTQSGGSGLASLAGDLSGDGLDDLLVVHEAGFSILVRDEQGGFALAHHHPNAGRPWAIADFDADGLLDVAASVPTGVHLYLGSGDGTGGFACSHFLAVTSSTSALAAADFDGDGLPDLAVLATDSMATHSVSILYNQGAASFSAPTTFQVPEIPENLTAGEFNGDGLADFALVGGPFGDQDAWLFLAQGDGSFHRSKLWESGFFGTSEIRAVGRLNGDAFDDVVLTTSSGFGGLPRTVVRLATGGFSFLTAQEWDESGLARLGDLDADGVLDLIRTSSLVGHGLATLLGNGDGTFAPRVEQPSDVTGISELCLVTRRGLERDVELAQILEPAPNGQLAFEGAPLAPRVRVRNRGRQSADVSVRLALGFDYRELREVTLAAGQSAELEFPQWAPSRFGRTPMQARCELTGDEFAANDELRSSVTIVSSTSAPVLLGLTPRSGGNAGRVSCLLEGSNFSAAAEVRLERDGEAALVGSGTYLEGPGRLRTSFDLRASPSGLFDLVVENPDSQVGALSSAFELLDGGLENVWVDIVARDALRTGVEESVEVHYGNSGSIDSPGGLLLLSCAPEATLIPDFAHALAPLPAGADAAEVPSELVSIGGAQVVPLQLLGLSAGSSAQLRLRVRANTSEPLELRATFVRFGLGGSSFGSPTAGPAPAGGACASSSTLDEADLPGLREAAAVARAELDEVGLAQFDPTHAAWARSCVDAAFRLGLRLLNEPCEGAAELDGWRVRSVALGDCHAGTILSSPHSGRHFYLDTALFFASYELDLDAGLYPLVELCQLGTQSNPRWMPIEDQAWKLSLLQASCGELEFVPYEAVHPEYAAIDRVVACPGQQNLAGPPDELPGPCFLAAQLGTFTLDPLATFAGDDKRGLAGAELADQEPALAQHFLRAGARLAYTIHFANAAAQASAQRVRITDALDLDALELQSFEFGAIAFAGHELQPLPGSREFGALVDLRPEVELIVRVTAALDLLAGSASWTLVALDPVSLEPTTTPALGFLPPDLAPPQGEGRVSFTIRARPPLATGSEVRNEARIRLDARTPVVTAEWLHTIDADAPESEIEALERVSGASVRVDWSGSDAGSGVADFDLFVAEDGADFEPWLSHTSATSALFEGKKGRTYAFRSLARDGVGNPEEPTFSTQAPSISLPAGGKKSSGGGSTCFIATAAYGSGWTQEVQSFRAFRDRWLLTNAPGRLAIRAYERLSPPLADFIRERAWARSLTRALLWPPLMTIRHPLLALAACALGACALARRLRGRPRRPALALPG